MENNQIIRFIDEHFAENIKDIKEKEDLAMSDRVKTKEHLIGAIEHALNLLKQI